MRQAARLQRKVRGMQHIPTVKSFARSRTSARGYKPSRAPSPAVNDRPANIPCFRPAIGEEEVEAVTAVLRSGWLTTGPKTREFEQAFAEYLGDEVETIAVSSATAGLHLAAEACGIGPGDEVIVPTLTFTATASVIRYLGARVVLVDVEEGSHLIDLEHAERRITPRCKAIMPVHFGGLPCDMPKVLEFARCHRLMVIEDAAHAVPARSQGRMIGASGSDACVFSFYANKTLTTGEGGMVATRNPRIAERVRLMRAHGLNRDAFDRFRKLGAPWAYDVVAPGFKYNMTDTAAAIGVVQLARSAALRDSRQRAAERYLEQLAGLPLDCPLSASPGDLHSWHLFTIRIHEAARATRDELIAALTAEGIGSSVHYRPLHHMSYWKGHCVFEPKEFAIADRYFAGAITLPLFSGMTDAQVDRVTATVRKVLE
jgi:dTDP-4-amino-4,6-dideoxygalactose transaminase